MLKYLALHLMLVCMWARDGLVSSRTAHANVSYSHAFVELVQDASDITSHLDLNQ